ncbi:hypothetical protein TNCV_1090021 [Trichonephila clavipes]|uniref:Uncharacterized protein n=1 Tax=Trichonephila clavipes TaxID=2585209 RepID=A0A8X6SZK5_TRICX|nr:hypothetical protein TNCV_1090021 [Trichonephila clavipes]
MHSAGLLIRRSMQLPMGPALLRRPQVTRELDGLGASVSLNPKHENTVLLPTQHLFFPSPSLSGVGAWLVFSRVRAHQRPAVLGHVKSVES